MPRVTIRSIDARRADDIPTDFGVLTGSPSEAASATYAPRRRWTTSSPFERQGDRERSRDTRESGRVTQKGVRPRTIKDRGDGRARPGTSATPPFSRLRYRLCRCEVPSTARLTRPTVTVGAYSVKTKRLPRKSRDAKGFCDECHKSFFSRVLHG